MGVNFFIRKKTIPGGGGAGGGPRGGLAKDHKKYGFFSGTLPLYCHHENDERHEGSGNVCRRSHLPLHLLQSVAPKRQDAKPSPHC